MGNGYPHRYSELLPEECHEQRSLVGLLSAHGVTKNQTQLKQLSTHACMLVKTSYQTPEPPLDSYRDSPFNKYPLNFSYNLLNLSPTLLLQLKLQWLFSTVGISVFGIILKVFLTHNIQGYFLSAVIDTCLISLRLNISF